MLEEDTMNTQMMTGEKDTTVESGMVVMEEIVEEAIMMVVAMMEVEKVNEEKEALALAIKNTIGQIKIGLNVDRKAYEPKKPIHKKKDPMLMFTIWINVYG